MKLLKVLVAVLVIAAMAVPVIAEDRLQLSGEMRVRGYLYDTDYTDFGEEDDDSGAWNDQRLRMLGKIAVAEGVSVVFRFDATESDENSSNAVAWGGSQTSAYQYSQRRADIQFDNAYLMVEKNGFTLKAGQQYFGFWGYTGKMMDVIGAGFTGQYKGLTLMHVKRLDENNGNDSFAQPNDGDVSLTGLKYDFKGEGFTLTPMVSYNQSDSAVRGGDRDLLALGLASSIDLGPVLLKGEFNYFDGEDNVGDIKGTQLYLDASMAATTTLRVGLMGFYALGDDEDEQATNNNFDGAVDWTFADWHPESYGHWSVEFVDEFADIYDPLGVNAGVMAAQLYADLQATENTSMKFAAMYFQNEDDEFIDYDGYTLNAGIAYKLAKNTTLSLHANYIKFNVDEVDGESVDADGDTLQAISGIQVAF
ncbi:MAG: porin [Desulfuromonadales bacterium]|nr:porin [Desulfuromonadales bacterium]